MQYLKALLLCGVVLGILLFVSEFGSRPESWSQIVLAFQARLAEAQVPVETVTAQPTPTALLPTPTADVSPTATVTTQATVTQSATVTATQAPTLTPTPTEFVPVASATPTLLVTMTPTIEPSPSTSPTPTPTVDPSLPQLEPTPVESGLILDGTIGPEGGRLASTDARIVLDVPPSSTLESLRFQVTRTERPDELDPSPDYPLFRFWDFSAKTEDGEDVHTFNEPIRVSIRFAAWELNNRVPESVRFWHQSMFEDPWEPVTAESNFTDASFFFTTSHFSSFGASATNLIDVAPLLDGRLVSLQSGAATFDVPIVLPPGRGGLAPKLSLSYNSARMGEMRDYTAATSWVGAGFSLELPHIQFAHDPTNTAAPDKARVFLSMGSDGGGELLQEGTDALGKIWRTRSEQFLRIRSCTNNTFYCEWTVWDKNGTKYVFGAGPEFQENDSRRWFWQALSPSGYKARVYRLDISYIEDTLGNRVDFVFWQHRQYDSGGRLVVKAAYPRYITYNGGAVKVVFNEDSYDNTDKTIAGWDEVDGQGQRIRYDTPRTKTSGGCEFPYDAPLVVETRKLKSLEVRVGDQLARRYNFNYESPEAFSTAGCPLKPVGGTQASSMRLMSVAATGRGTPEHPKGQEYNFTTTSFTYWPRTETRSAYENGSTVNELDFNWPHVKDVLNGFGGSVQFDYGEKGVDAPGWHWTRQAVEQVNRTAGASQPIVSQTYEYSPYAPVLWRCSDPTDPDECDSKSASIIGFAEVAEKDVSQNKTIHKFHTPASGTDFANEVRAGLEYETIWLDPSSAQWHKTHTEWAITPIANEISAGWGTFRWVNFVYPFWTDTWLRYQTDSDRTRVENTFDAYGNHTSTLDWGVYMVSGDGLRTTIGYNGDVSKWIFKPKYQATTDPNAAELLLACGRFYYDGAKNVNPSSLTRGLLTAQSKALSGTSTACNGTSPFAEAASSYSVYDAYGNVVQSSVPTGIEPEDSLNSSQSSTFGWIPTDVPKSTTAFDSVHHVYPVSQTDPEGNPPTLISEADWDFVIGKPKKIVEPNLHTTNLRYDDLGRATKSWDDSFDSETYPTTSFSYTWGTVPNSTKVVERVNHLTTNIRTSTSCTDGFGREIEVRTPYLGALNAVTRTDYDPRGMVAAKTNPVQGSTSSNCSSPVNSISTLDRTTFAYDPLGNVTTTTAIGPGVSSQTIADYRGLETTFCDENFNKIRRVSNPNLRTLTVYEPAAASTSCSATVAANATVYTYDKSGQLKQLDDPLLNRTTMAYDLGGRKTAMHDPDMGNWTYQYNAAGSLTSQTDARGITTTLTYDAMERLTGKSYAGAAVSDPPVSFHYDTYLYGSPCAGTTAPGRMTQMDDAAGTQYSCFDLRGRVTKTSRHLTGDPPSTLYDVDSTYHARGDLKTLTYPDDGLGREVLTYGINSTGGNVVSMASTNSPWTQTFFTSLTSKPNGAPASVSWGNTLSTTYGYDYRMRLTSINTGAVQDVDITYDAASNVDTVTDPQDVIDYDYDHLNRLTSMEIDGSEEAQYAYNAIGNMTYKREGAEAFELLYPVSGVNSIRPHAVGATVYTPLTLPMYDANGNMTAWWPLATFRYNAENKVSLYETSLGKSTYLYDGNGTLVRRTDYPSATEQTTTILRSNASGAYAEWSATASPHYTTIDESSVDYGDYINSSTAGQLDTHKYPSAAIPANAYINTVYLSFTWKHDNPSVPNPAGADMRAVFRQAGQNTTSQEFSATQADGWVASNWQMATNPRTGQPWTPAELNSGEMEFGFQTQSTNGAAPKVAFVYLQVSYSIPTSSTVYIGGVYERNFDSAGAPTGTAKYYRALGRSVAMRTTGSAGGTGTVRFLLADHLGSTVSTTSAAGVEEQSQAYWPYGGPRTGTSTQTDKRFTGQQAERFEAVGLGVYNYKARLYSTMTGKFLSADPLALDTSNRYAYVRNNPLRFVDPSGLYLLVVCGWKQDCSDGPNGDSFGSFESHVKAHWTENLGKTAAQADWLWQVMSWTWWSLTDEQRAQAFDVTFFDASYDTSTLDEASAVEDLATYVAALNAPLTHGFGHSFGGIVLHDFLAGTELGFFPRLTSFKGAILNAAPSHAALDTYDRLFRRNAWRMHDAGILWKWSYNKFDFPMITRGGAAEAMLLGLDTYSWVPRLIDTIAGIDLTVNGAANLSPSDGGHGNGAASIIDDFRRLKDMAK